MSSDEEARSTERPPAPGDEPSNEDPHRDIAAAIRRAKTNASPGRYGPPAATAKIDKFELAQALALTTAEDERAPSSSKPPRDDGAPFVSGEEVTSSVPADHVEAQRDRTPESSPAVPKPRSGNLGLLLLGLLLGAAVMAYAYATTR